MVKFIVIVWLLFFYYTIFLLSSDINEQELYFCSTNDILGIFFLVSKTIVQISQKKEKNKIKIKRGNKPGVFNVNTYRI